MSVRQFAPIRWFAVCLFLGVVCMAVVPAVLAVELKSPDGRIVVTLDVRSEGRLAYRVDYSGRPVLTRSGLGLVLRDAPPLDRGFKITAAAASSHDSTWKTVCGERAEVRDHYNQIVVDLEDDRSPPRKLRITLRAYDEGAALCYTIPKQPGLEKLTIDREVTEFHFTGNHVCWPVYSAQGVYASTTLDKVKPNCERPLVVRIDGGPTVAVAEARLVDYARMRLAPVKDAPHALVSQLASEVVAETPYTTPWRVVMVADTPAQLAQRNYLILNLNDPCAIEDTSWIKPGKVIREVTLTTAGGKACIDLAVKMGLQYVEYDAGWYGHEYADESDATTVSVDPKRSRLKNALDLHEVIRYGRERGVGIIVYVNRRSLERPVGRHPAALREMGDQGRQVRVRAGRLAAVDRLAPRRDSQGGQASLDGRRPRRVSPDRLRADLSQLHDLRRHPGQRVHAAGRVEPGDPVRADALRTGRQHGLLVLRPESRPRGLINSPPPVVLYSPWQFLYWYDRPQQFQGEPELEFFKRVPTTWDETRVVQGEIGQYVTTARRKGREWFVGSMNAVRRRQLDVPLTFLQPGVKYSATVYGDAAPDGSDSKKVAICRTAVDSTTVLKADMAANGGQAVRIVPQDKKE